MKYILIILVPVFIGCCAHKTKKPEIRYISCESEMVRVCGMELPAKRVACFKNLKPTVYEICKVL